MNIIEGQDLIQHIYTYDVILVGTSTMNALGNGFQRKIALNFPYVSDANKETPYGDPRKLGTVKVVKREGITFLLCYINKGRSRPDLNPDYLDYEALDDCLSIIEDHFQDKKIGSTIIGNSIYEGNGDRDKILKLIGQYNLDIDLYDYEQTDFNEDDRLKWKEVVAHMGTEDYVPMKKKFFWERAFGELTPIPEECKDMSDKDIKNYIKQKKAEQ